MLIIIGFSRFGVGQLLDMLGLETGIPMACGTEDLTVVAEQDVVELILMGEDRRSSVLLEASTLGGFDFKIF